MRNTIVKSLFILFLFVLFAFDLARPIVLTAADIGRHIKNGELILQGHSEVLYKNFYSFTYPDYPFVNHHWLFGVMSYLVEKSVGFTGLSIVYIIILLLALFFFLRAALLRGHFALVMFLAFLVLPMLADRREIRPEGLSLLFMGLYFYLLTKLSLGQVRRWVIFIVIGLTQVIWVNTHIFFFMGPALVAIFLWEGKSRDCTVCVRALKPLLWWTLGLNLLNPSFIVGALTPLNIFKEFGYRLAENQTLFFMMNRFPKEQIYPYYFILAVVALVGMVWALRAYGAKKNAPFAVLLVFLAAAGFRAVRLMSPFAFFLIPLGAFFYAQIEGQWPQKMQNTARAFLIMATIALGVHHAQGFRNDPPAGVGLLPGINASAEFFKMNHIKGPVFSNYDIGGYLIYHLHGIEPVFVDNRQEAFPPAFFKDTYVPMQEDETIWKRVDAQHHFNAIYFYRHDLTPWGQNFLVGLLRNPQWAPVFVDGYTIIFLKRNGPNQPVIDHFELPATMFGVSH